MRTPALSSQYFDQREKCCELSTAAFESERKRCPEQKVIFLLIRHSPITPPHKILKKLPKSPLLSGNLLAF